MQKNVPVEILITVPFPQSLVDQLQDISPKLHITVIPAESAEDISDDQWLRTEVLYTETIFPEPDKAPNLQWLQTHLAGAEDVLYSSLVQKPGLLITTMSGAAVSKIAEYTIMMMLAMGHNLPELIKCQSEADWPEDRITRFTPRQELWGSTVGIVGYGSIGREIARLLIPFGVTILATKRDAMNPRDSGYVMDGHGDPDGNMFHRLYPIQALRSMLKECDFIIVSLPLSNATNNIIAEEELEMVKPSAFLINIGRGEVVSESALIKCLQENRIAGAALDVFSTEPLPQEHPLWQMPNVILSPHIAGVSSHYDDWAMTLFVENIKRYLAGGVLLNRIDLHKGY